MEKTFFLSPSILKNIDEIIKGLYQYVRKDDFRGWDVFDGLNSKFFKRTVLYNNRYARLLWIQIFKRSPVNFRLLVGVPKADNPKALALFISGLLNLYKITHEAKYLEDIKNLTSRLLEYSCSEYGGKGWGYNFPWQARAFYVPAFKPNMIVSVFVGHAFLDLYKFLQDDFYLEQAILIGEFIQQSLILFEETNKLCLGYIPGEKTIVHNANLLGAGFLARLFSFTDIPRFKNIANKAVYFSVNAQREDGAWVYGTAPHHQWIDNFHTGYNLWALQQYQQYTGIKIYSENIIRGLKYHLQHHFIDKHIPKYLNNKIYPIDIHCFSQALITFIHFYPLIPEYEERIHRVMHYLMHHMYHSKKHFFYFQKHYFYTIKIPYIRWSQAWMFYALSEVLKKGLNHDTND